MEVIDDHGRLFGRVNVIDALVVLVVVAVVAAGIALVGASGTDETETEPVSKYATLSLGTHPTWFGSQVQLGDNLTVSGSRTALNVTDVHLLATDTGSVEVIVQAEYTVTTPDENGDFRVGQDISVETDTYRTKATPLVVGSDRAGLQNDRVPVVATTTVSESTAAAIKTGETFRVDDRDLATIESVRSLPRLQNGRRHVVMGLTLRTVELSGSPWYTDRPLEVGTRVPFQAGHNGSLSGTVSAIGTTTPQGDATNVTMTVAWEDVRPSVAEEVSVGDGETHRGATSRVTALENRPATVIQPNSAGELVESEHPRNRDVTLTVTATARRTDSGLRLHGRPLQDGQSVVLEFDSATVKGTILDVETDE